MVEWSTQIILFHTWMFLLISVLTTGLVRKFSLFASTITVVDQLYEAVFSVPVEFYFSGRMLTDLIWLLMIAYLIKDTKLRNNLAIPVFISYLSSAYSQFDQSAHFIYEHWEQIQFICFEWITAVLLSSNGKLKDLEDWVHDKIHKTSSRFKRINYKCLERYGALF